MHVYCFAGTVHACYHDFIYDQTELYIDPTSHTTYTPWELRDHPVVHWDAEDTELFTLIVLNPVDPIPHNGLFVNIVGDNFTTGQVNVHAKIPLHNQNIQSILQYDISL